MTTATQMLLGQDHQTNRRKARALARILAKWAYPAAMQTTPVCDAFLVSHAVLDSFKDFLNEEWKGDINTIYVSDTTAGNHVLIPAMDGEPVQGLIDGCPFRWPVLPLVVHMNGLFTATALHMIKTGNPVIVDAFTLQPIEKKGSYPKTANRVFWADRSRHLVMVEKIC